MRTIHLIRHEATELNNSDLQKDRIRGWQDWKLSEEGRYGAVKLAERIRKNPPDILISSDLTRATQTAKIIAGWCDIPLVGQTRWFRPWDVGNLVGTRAADTICILARHVEMPDEPVPGGESFNNFYNRFFDGLKRTMDTYRGAIGIVTHHRNERLLKARLPNGAIDIAEFTRRGEQPGHWEIMEIPDA